MNEMERQELYDEQHAFMSGPGCEARLILRTPNNKDFKKLEECHFYDEFQQFKYEAINDVLFSELYYLRDKIKDYCNRYSFVTYESQPALELVVYDTRDRVWL